MAGPVPTLIEDGRNLGLGVVVEQGVDLGNDLARGLVNRKRYERPTLPTRGPPCSQLDAELKFQGNSSRMRECGWPAAIFSSVLLSQA